MTVLFSSRVFPTLFLTSLNSFFFQAPPLQALGTRIPQSRLKSVLLTNFPPFLISERLVTHNVSPPLLKFRPLLYIQTPLRSACRKDPSPSPPDDSPVVVSKFLSLHV